MIFSTDSLLCFNALFSGTDSNKVTQLPVNCPLRDEILDEGRYKWDISTVHNYFDTRLQTIKIGIYFLKGDSAQSTEYFLD